MLHGFVSFLLSFDAVIKILNNLLQFIGTPINIYKVNSQLQHCVCITFMAQAPDISLSSLSLETGSKQSSEFSAAEDQSYSIVCGAQSLGKLKVGP